MTLTRQRKECGVYNLVSTSFPLTKLLNSISICPRRGQWLLPEPMVSVPRAKVNTAMTRSGMGERQRPLKDDSDSFDICFVRMIAYSYRPSYRTISSGPYWRVPGKWPDVHGIAIFCDDGCQFLNPANIPTLDGATLG